jgi:hypothetical protein
MNKYEHKIHNIDVGALSWSVNEQWKNLLKDLDDGWEIVYHYLRDSSWPIFILRRSVSDTKDSKVGGGKNK